MTRVLTMAVLLLGLSAVAQTATLPATTPATNAASKPAGKARFTISKETTYFTEPLLEDGRVDYLRALNDQAGKGVTKDNNFAVVMLEVMGPAAMGVDSQQVADTLGVRLPKEGMDPSKVDIGEALKRPFTAKDLPAVAKWLQQNKKAIDTIVEGSKRARWFVPLEPGKVVLYKTTFGGVYAQIKSLAKVLGARASMAIGERRYGDAWQDIQAIYRISALLAQDPTLLGQLVGLALPGLADGAAQELATRADLSADLAYKFADEVAKAPAPPNLISALLAGRAEILHAIQWLATHDVAQWDAVLTTLGADLKEDAQEIHILKKFHDSVDVDAVMKQVNKQFDVIAETMSIKNFQERQKQSELLKSAAKNMSEDKLGDDPSPTEITAWAAVNAASVLVSLDPGKAQSIVDAAHVSRKLTELAFLLRAYKKENGVFPDSLKDLVGKRLKEVPNDIDGKPIRYQKTKTGCTLTSVGRDGKPDDKITHNDLHVVMDDEK